MEDNSNLYEIARRYRSLTARQKQVCDLVALDNDNAVISEKIGMPLDSIVLYKQVVMHKMGAKQVPELNRMIQGIKNSTFIMAD
jgi:FixJ family two-component response regulator